ncbi:MAG: sodium:proton antiporter [Magnetococcales bacterium]|nr:sodium:proton antiporter [Magnetococcales bacterium]
MNPSPDPRIFNVTDPARRYTPPPASCYRGGTIRERQTIGRPLKSDILQVLASIGLAALLCQWLAWHLGLPAIVPLLLTGLLLGPGLGWLQPDALLGDLLYPLVSLSVSAILFEGSLHLRFRDIRGLETVVRSFLTAGLLTSWIGLTVASHGLFGFAWPVAGLFGAIAVVSGPTVVGPMLRAIRPSRKIAGILRWESILLPPMGAILALLVFEFIVSSGHGKNPLETTLATFGSMLFVGIGLGITCGLGFAAVLRRHALPSFLHNIGALSLVFALFALANALQAESGLLAVTLMGLTLANSNGAELAMDAIKIFKASISVLLISTLFIVLAARIRFPEIIALGPPALGLLLTIQFITNPLRAWIATYGHGFSAKEILLLGWIGPRGIVAAAVATLIAFRLEQEGYPEARTFIPLMFMLILGTVFFQGLTAAPLARRLRLTESSGEGFLILGSNEVARAVAVALKQCGARILIADTNWHSLRRARYEGLEIFYGNPLSQFAEHHLDLSGIGNFLGLASAEERNLLTAHHLRDEFGPDHLFILRNHGDHDAERHKLGFARFPVAHTLFGSRVSHANLAGLLARGGRLQQSLVTTPDGLPPPKALPLFALDLNNTIHLYTTTRQPQPAPGWTLVCLHNPAEIALPRPSR